MQQRIDSDANCLVQRWNRLQMHVRCGLSAHHPGCVRLYVHTGLAIARRGIRPAGEVHFRVLQTLLGTGQDEAMPWFWRSVCLEYVDLPLAHLTTILIERDPVALRAIEAGVQRARDQLPALPSAWVIDEV